jgi:hypothetical protein
MVVDNPQDDRPSPSPQFKLVNLRYQVAMPHMCGFGVLECRMCRSGI